MRYVLIIVSLVLFLQAKIVDKIAVVVADEPITSYQIQKLQKQLNITKQQAISYLIEQAVFKIALKQKDIYVDEFDIDNALENIAKKNNLTLFEFKNKLLNDGKLEQFTQKIRQDIQRQKLIQTLNITVSAEEMQKYYNTHKDEFSIPTKITVTRYLAKTKEDLMNVISNPLSANSNVQIQTITFTNQNASAEMMNFLSHTKTDTFTQIIPIQGGFVVFYINQKSDFTTIPYNKVQNVLYEKLLRQKQQKALKDFLAKIRATLDIEFKKD
ncbi:MAG: hypothetical protein GXO40_00790 [Epsilonproteobacteria bacterium]|nr:hypothetical protein [Campylobacterota bacterium]